MNSIAAGAILADPALAAHVAEIHRLRKRFTADTIEIGRHLTECQGIVGHGNWQTFLDREFEWSATTAPNFMRVFALTETESTNFADLDLPVSSLYLLAAPSTPEEARTEIISRAEAGEKVSGAEVKEAIARAKREQNGTASITPDMPVAAETESTADDKVTLWDHKTGKEYVEGDHVGDDHAGSGDAGDDHVGGGDQPAPDEHAAGTPAPTEPAPDPAAITAAAVNQLSAVELQSFLDQLAPAHKRAFKQKFGARDSDNTNAEIAALAGECSALLTHPQQNTDAIRKKLARIKKLAGGDKARTSNAKLDDGAFTRGMGIAGQADKKFPTMPMTPDGVDESGNAIFALPRGDRSKVH